MLAPVYKLSGTSQGSMEQQEEQPHVKERWSVRRRWVLRKAAAFNQLEWEGGRGGRRGPVYELGGNHKRPAIYSFCMLRGAVIHSGRM